MSGHGERSSVHVITSALGSQLAKGDGDDRSCRKSSLSSQYALAIVPNADTCLHQLTNQKSHHTAGSPPVLRSHRKQDINYEPKTHPTSLDPWRLRLLQI